jgi:hypothetical protein
MKGGRIALPSEYFTGENSGNYSEENANSHTQGGQQNCGDSYGPDLKVQNGGRLRRRRSQRKNRSQKQRKNRSQRKTRSQRKNKSQRQRKQNRSQRRRQSRN